MVKNRISLPKQTRVFEHYLLQNFQLFYLIVIIVLEFKVFLDILILIYFRILTSQIY